ncbi:MAG: hypothetical protein JO073_07385 [Actinobacteria bacterium]|nr:hypothetical protein [Actinomycetota bacterium]
MRTLLVAALLCAAAVAVGTAAAGPPPAVDPSVASDVPPGLANLPSALSLPPELQRLLGKVAPFISRFAGSSRGLGPLRYHGGPVQHSQTVYAIYWIPSGYSIATNYDGWINWFLYSVGVDSGKTSNVYYADTQYGDTSGPGAYRVSWGGTYTDRNPLPSSGCTDSYTSVCVTDAQLQAELQKAIAAAGWTPGPNKEFFVFTAKGIGSCYSAGSCAFSNYCAYHSWFGSGSSTTIYANMPYADTAPPACDAGAQYHPNGNDADPEISLISHEQNETITDQFGNAWYDLIGYEDGDKCAWIFGGSTGSTAYGQYNQTINGYHYYVQEEYSNATSSCVQTGT